MSLIPLERVLAKLDEQLDKNEKLAAENHLKYWLSEAKEENDQSGVFALLNEFVGFYRKENRQEDSLSRAEELLRLTEQMDLSDTVGGATAFLNCATAYKAFSRPEDALPLYEKAKAIYERELPENDPRLGALYNNMALALTDVGRFEEAEELYQNALSVMESVPGGCPEQAVTELNLAELYERRYGPVDGEKQIFEALDRACLLLSDRRNRQDGNYAFVLEKCVPTLRHFGYFADAETFAHTAENIRRELKG